MTEFKPLGYAASVLILAMVVAYAAAWQWAPEFPRYARLLWAGPWHMLMWGAGKIMEVLSVIALACMAIAWSLLDLWTPRIAKPVDRKMEALLRYLEIRVHQPRHAG